MAAAGINTVRTYTVPPPDLLDIALRHGLRVMVGLAWPQHIPFLDDPQLARQIRHDAANAVRRLVAAPRDAHVRRRQRDPGRDRAMARPPPHRAIPARALSRMSRPRRPIASSRT